jgi:hypothetical protein
MDKVLFTFAFYCLFTPLRFTAATVNKLSFLIFLLGAWFISPWAKLAVVELPAKKGE